MGSALVGDMLLGWQAIDLTKLFKVASFVRIT
jgi:hypothetical protein